MTVYTTDTSAQPGAGGAAQNWTFNNLILASPTISTGLDVSNTPFAGDYPTANVALESSSTYEYFNSTANDLFQLGATNGAQFVKFTPGISYLIYPFSYINVALTPSFTGTHQQGTLTGSNMTTADSYGTMVINGQTFSDVLRLHVVQDIDYDYTGNGHLIYHSETYTWYDGVHKTPVMQIIISDFSGFASGHFKTVTIGDFAVGTPGIKAPTALFNLFPNPASNVSNISVALQQSAMVKIKIYDNTGSQILMKDLGEQFPGTISESLDVATLAKGIYTINVIADGVINTKRLIVY